MAKPRAIVTRRWPSANEERLKQNFDVVFNELLIVILVEKM